MRGKALAAAAIAAALSLVGCSTAAPSASQPATTAASSAPAGGAGGEVGVFTWWADGSEKLGLEALQKLFKEQYPNDTFVNLAVAGGAGTNAKAKLSADLQNGNPPDSFQGHAGAELQDYIRADQIEPVNDVIDALGGSQVFPQTLLDLLTVQGNIYSVPSNIHRANVVWANPAVLKKAGVTAEPADIDAWIADMDKVKAVRGFDPAEHRWHLDPGAAVRDRADLRPGCRRVQQAVRRRRELGVRRREEGGRALHQAAQLRQHRFRRRRLAGATDMVIEGKAAYNVMGDWAVAEFASKNKKDTTDYIYFPVPGNKGVFDFLADSFTLPKGAKNAAGAKDWLALVGSAEGQQAFNLAKGSIPARTDVAPTEFPPYQQSAMAAFKSDKIAASIAHGAAVSLSWNSDISSAISKFYGSKDQATLIADLVAAAKKHAV